MLAAIKYEYCIANQYIEVARVELAVPYSKLSKLWFLTFFEDSADSI